MQTEKRFRTKTGYCHITDDKIILTRDGIIGNVSNALVGNGISKILLIYSAISIYLLYSAYTNFRTENYLSAIFSFAIACYLVFGIFKSINNSATPIIERDKIKNVKFINAKVGYTRSRFEIMFENESGKLKKD